ncbi:MAG: hypothetical protein JWO56_1739 [Acidobacteria bacterium]|nr:hypothetical protein [Acidobacteriota bacterium]
MRHVNGARTPAIKRDEDLGVLHALAAELGMNLTSVLPDDPVERGHGETCEVPSSQTM